MTYYVSSGMLNPTHSLTHLEGIWHVKHSSSMVFWQSANITMSSQTHSIGNVYSSMLSEDRVISLCISLVSAVVAVDSSHDCVIICFVE